MKSILKATAVLGASSVVTATFGLVTAKASAIYLGPAGVGVFGLLQSLVSIIQLIAGLGLSAGLVRLGASAAQTGDEATMHALRRAGTLIVIVTSLVAIVVLITLRTPIARVMLGGTTDASAMTAVMIAVPFAVATVLANATLNTYHRVRALALVAITGGAAGTLFQVALFRFRGVTAVPAAVAIAAAAQCACAVAGVALAAPRRKIPTVWSQVRTAARELLKFGFPYTLSSLGSAGALLVLPALVLRLLNLTSVGYFRAAFAISATYLAVVLSAMSQDYFPRIAAQQRRESINETANEQVHLLLLVGGSMILMAIVFAPVIVRVIYTTSFLPAVTILRWQLIGDIFKLLAWSLSFVVLAKAPSWVFLITEIGSGALMLALVAGAVKAIGLAGLGVAYAVAYLVYTAIAWRIVGGLTGFRWQQRNVLLFAVLLVVATVARLLPDFRVATYDISVGIIPATAYCLFALWRVYGAGIRPLHRATSPVEIA